MPTFEPPSEPAQAVLSSGDRPTAADGGEDRLRVLFLSHNHPSFHPGGAEIYALHLHRAMRRSGRFECLLVAAAAGRNFPHHVNRAFFRVREDDPSELVWSVPHFDDFYFTSHEKKSYTRDLRTLLQTFRPDVVHVQHTLRLGVEALTEIRRSCPRTPIVYTLHEFLLLCFSRGIMLRRNTDERCGEAAPWRCHQCFPERTAEEFVLRERFIKTHLESVDLFLAPSRYLQQQYVDWGLEPERIHFHDYGRDLPPRSAESESVDTRRFAFIGQTMRHKGILVLLQAMKILVDRGETDIFLYLDGANMDFDGDDYVREVKQKLDECRGRVLLRGAYSQDELPSRLRDVGWVVVPSIWWENSPLVIQEAFMHRRPVITSNIGGMAEKVTDGVDGLHFRAGDPVHLAEVLAEAAGNDELWKRLHSGISEVLSLSAAVDELETIYRRLRREKATPRVV
jgi:glycosyltransferase involved in cell wall biosynthesis